MSGLRRALGRAVSSFLTRARRILTPGGVDFGQWPDRWEWQEDLRDHFADALDHAMSVDGVEGEFAAAYARAVMARMNDSHFPDHLYRQALDIAEQARRDATPDEDTRAALAALLDPANPRVRAFLDSRSEQEVHTLTQAATYAAAAAESLETGRPVGLLWRTRQDNRVRPAHHLANGQQRIAGRAFVVGGEPLRWPGDPLGSPANTMNCRCRLHRVTATLTASMGDPMPDASVPGTWGPSPVAPLDSVTTDGRILRAPEDGEFRSRAFPLPLQFQEFLMPAHSGARQGLARMDRAWVAEVDGRKVLMAEGTFDMADPQGAELARKVHEKFLGGVSVDLDRDLYSADREVNEDGHEVISNWTLGGATLTARPAFAELANISPPTAPAEHEDEVGVEPVVEAGRLESADVPSAGGEVFGAQSIGDLPIADAGTPWDGPAAAKALIKRADGKRADGFLWRDSSKPVDEAGAYKLPVATVKDGKLVIVPHAVNAVASALAGGRGGVDIPEGDKDKIRATVQRIQARVKEQRKPASVTSSTGTVTHPPAAFFADPCLPGPTPLTITREGRVIGHMAAFTIDGRPAEHTGRPGIQVPRDSGSGYRHFMVGATETAEGDIIATGNIVLGTPHAPGAWDMRQTADWYADTGQCVATVRVGEDAHGIWVSGALVPGITPVQLAALRRSPLSGDWRTTGGALELIASLAVNNQGFTVPRTQARTEQGRPYSLVAAGALEPAPETPDAAADHQGVAELAAQRAVMLHEQRGRERDLFAAVDQVFADSAMAAAALAFRASDRAPRTRRKDDDEDQVPEPSEDDVADGEYFGECLDHDCDSAEFANWVQKTGTGHLPRYIKRISKHLTKKGMTKGHAIATAVNAAKKMCATGDLNWPGLQSVNAGSKAQACKAVAEWEAKKAEAKAKRK
ncbi:hypothetical protein [Streptomyces sp. NPDC087300]|uniref:hypothetical protein n=1 Tax=Streptomyces sp. NPDC087300 TaxID=3365780 RepID=UPI00380E9455